MKNDLKIRLKLDDKTLDDVNQKMFLRIKRKIISLEDNIYQIPRELFTEDKRVKDEIRYKVKGNKVDFIGESVKGKGGLNNYMAYEKVVILLESPHRDEYDYSFKPIGPAQGVTGNNIEKFLKELCESLNLDKNKEYLFILMNPIQWQCSLGSFYDKILIATFRNNIWSELFKKYKEEFKSQIELYNPTIIINACTRGRKSRVMEVINKTLILSNAKKFHCYHPSCWHYKGIELKEY